TGGIPRKNCKRTISASDPLFHSFHTNAAVVYLQHWWIYTVAVEVISSHQIANFRIHYRIFSNNSPMHTLLSMLLMNVPSTKGH
ncbi:hypothetical protein BDZ97DRAFT_1832508, partial [Flammula alnicola]